MRRWIVILLVVLAGCSIDVQDLPTRLEKVVETSLTSGMPSILNHRTPYYSYYLPRHIGKRFSNHVAAIFVANDQEIVMNVDVPAIIMQRYYRSQLVNNLRVLTTNEQALFTHEGSFVHHRGETMYFNVSISQKDQDFTIILQTNHFIFSSVVPSVKVEPVLSDMLTLMKTATANRNDIVEAYSNKQVIDYQQQVLEIFQQVAPESGTLADMDRLVSGNLDFSGFIDEGKSELPDTDEPNDVAQ